MNRLDPDASRALPDVEEKARPEAVESPRVSIVLPTYERAHVLGRAIRSVLSQTDEEWEIVVVDDGSTDEPDSVVRGFADRRIRIIRHAHNRGAPAARNTGMESSRGQFIAFLDSDDEWAPEKLAAQLNGFAQWGPRVVAIVCGVRVVTSQGERIGLPYLHRDPAQQLTDFESGVIRTSALMIRRSVVEEGIRFDEQLPAYQEHDFLLQIVHKGLGVAGLGRPLVTARYDDGQDHISNPSAQLGALEMIGRKYLAGMSREGRSRYHLKLMRVHLDLGNVEDARLAVRRAALAEPLVARRWPIIVSSFLGDRLFNATYSIYRQLAPARW